MNSMRALGRLALMPALIALGLWFWTTQPFVRPLPFQPPQPDTARMQEHVRHLSETLYPRSFDHPATLPAIPGVAFSDHLNYWQLGIPALMVTDTSFYRNTEYHLGGDTFERLDYARMAQVVQGIFAFIQASAPESGH